MKRAGRLPLGAVPVPDEGPAMHSSGVGEPARKGVELTGHSSARLLRWGVPLAAVAVLVAFGVSSLASATGSSSQASKASVRKTVTIRGNNRPHFVGPKSISTGDKLRVINKTNPQKIGPHTFSLIESSVIPRTRHAKRTCFRSGHICRKIARWHGSNGRTPITRNPVRVGHKGWDQAGNLHRRGDSYFAGHKGSSFQQRVSADNGVVLRFMCAVHPEMRKRIVVH